MKIPEDGKLLRIFIGEAVPIPINRSSAEIGAVQTTILGKK